MILAKSSYKYFSKNYLQTLLAITGIVLGVSILVSIDLCIASSKKAFEISINQSFGKSTHFVSSASSNSFADSIYTKLRSNLDLEGVSPVLEREVFVKNPQSLSQSKIKILGIDPFAYKDFAQNTSAVFENRDTQDFKDFLLEPFCGYLSLNTAQQLGLKEPGFVDVQVGSEYKRIKILKFVNSKEYDDLILMDIASAQELLGEMGKIDRIDLIIRNAQELQQVKAFLSQDLELNSTLKSKKSTQQMLDSFNLNLYCFSFLSLIVTVFLIYNTMSFTTLQRQTTFGIMRSIGLKQNEIFKIVIAETLTISLFASILGLLFGVFLSSFLIKSIAQTINDLYFVVQISEINLDYSVLAKGMVAGVCSALCGALIPAWEASKIPAIQLTKRSNQESRFDSYLPRLLGIALLLSLLALLILRFSETNLVFNFLALALIIISYALITPVLIKALVTFFDKFVFSRANNLDKIAIRSINKNLSRTAIAIIALMMALSISLSLDLTVSSFRATVQDWLEASLQSDLYISAPSLSANKTTGYLSETLMTKVYSNPVIKANAKSISSYRDNEIIAKFNSNVLHRIRIASVETNKSVSESFKFKSKLSNWLERFKSENSIIVSEPLAYKYNLRLGSTVLLKTNSGFKKFAIVGIFFDYGSDQGIAMINKINYQKQWGDYKISSLGILLKDDLPKNKITEVIKFELSKINREHDFSYRSNRDLKIESMKIFDRTFEITKALKFIAIIIAFIAVLSTLLALNIERYREYAILEALGLNKKVLAKIIMMQSLLMGLIAAILAVPAGLIQAYLLINVINLRSFGWTLNFHWQPEIILEIFAVALIAAFVAALYPATKHIRGALALRND